MRTNTANPDYRTRPMATDVQAEKYGSTASTPAQRAEFDARPSAYDARADKFWASFKK